MNRITRFLLWTGFVARGRKSNQCRLVDGRLEYIHPEGIRWPFHAPPWWQVKLLLRGHAVMGWKPYVFRNLPGVKKWVPGRLLPWRWGFGWLGFEFGDRGH